MSYITLGGVNQLIYKILGSIIYNLVFNFQDKVFISIICKMTNMSFKPFFFPKIQLSHKWNGMFIDIAQYKGNNNARKKKKTHFIPQLTPFKFWCFQHIQILFLPTNYEIIKMVKLKSALRVIINKPF